MMTQDEARAALHQLVDAGWLIGVEVFGGMGCEEAGHEWGFGLCDVFSNHSIGSDCNRAEKFLLRPSDSLMEPALAAMRVDESRGFTPAP